jgi:hypothetical protein
MSERTLRDVIAELPRVRVYSTVGFNELANEALHGLGVVWHDSACVCVCVTAGLVCVCVCVNINGRQKIVLSH